MWAQAHRMEAAAERSWLLASQALEAAAVLDQSRTDVRALFADVLYERALLAERNHQSQLRDELVQRLALYDDGGERQRRWSAPALLTVASNPPGASVVLHRFTEDSEKKLRLHRLRDLGQTPIAAVETARGSYLLTFELAGRFPVRYPVLLGRGERFRVEVDLPPAPAVPSGFVYIPPGRFLFGSAADEEVRRGFFDTVPLHEVRTGAFLIGRTEVTFAEWLELLRSLPRDERARRQPRVASKVGGATGSIKLTEGAGGWRLTIMPAQRVYTAAAGEKLYYGRRRAREVQDWLRFPVTGISAHDAEAYVAWLDRTGRVPGARLCTEYEWARAARGADDRTFPHGYRLDPEDANYDETYGKDPLGMGPDEIGAHPASRSPFGLEDMSGNAWEWTTSSLAPGQYVGRGGSYFYDQKTNQIVNRQVSVPTLRDATLGFRVCADPPRAGR
jgi:formylglycine-generating enzyme required for sulfatase activity